MRKDGHTDVASSRKMMQTVIEDARDILNALPEDEEASLPTWWTNKLAVSSAYINSARDYLVYSGSDSVTTVTNEMPAMMAPMASQDSMTPNGNLVVGDYQTKHFDICPTAQLLYTELSNNPDLVDMAEESAILQDQIFKIEKRAIAANSATDEMVHKAEHYADMIMEIAEEMDMVDEHAYVKDTHIAKIKQLAGMDTIMEDNSNEVQLPPSYMMMQNAS